ncbi:hypothetical protein [Cohnella hashimotonis]|uniref:Uncharacterized protein n=1 Tax=Cohnella hashimotonis TaxID=2826895 RepID=A0ABT6TRE4_9BACL|nr:hypothetical protein [Cohnella hashimotonis]MDI4649370.1 hypothetical protein [Cohnella hashimotonis]
MGDALKIKRNEEKVLEEKSLLRSAKAVYDEYKLFAAREGGNFLLKQLVNLIAESPNANHFFDYHKVHAQYLAQILYAVGKMEPIEQEIENVRMNVDAYLRDAGQLLDAVAQFPADPLSGIRNPVVILEIARDPKAAAAYDDILDTYQKAAELALSGLSNAAAQGRAMEQETRQQAQVILDKLNAMAPTIPADQVFIGAAKKRVQFIQLDLMTKVQDLRARSETAAKRIEPLLADVRQIDRIGRR